ncbi:MAG: hypothetical protein M3N95_10605 [Actinomycetota bacterium]|nr:hypothetical protein [Actinomycetota bacterium]
MTTNKAAGGDREIRRRRRFAPLGVAVILAAATIGVGLGLAPSAFAAGPFCNTTLIGGATGTVIVPSGAVCNIVFETVHGTVIVQSGGTLHTFDSSVSGSIVATNAQLLDISNTSASALVVTGLAANATDASTVCGSTFGSVVIQNITPGNNDNELDFGDDAGYPYLGCPGNTVHGSLTLTHNSAETEVDLNVIGGSVVVSGNTGPVDLSGNQIHANLVCISPTVEGQVNRPKDDEIPNTVGGVQLCDINTAG